MNTTAIKQSWAQAALLVQAYSKHLKTQPQAEQETLQNLAPTIHTARAFLKTHKELKPLLNKTRITSKTAHKIIPTYLEWTENRYEATGGYPKHHNKTSPPRKTTKNNINIHLILKLKQLAATNGGLQTLQTHLDTLRKLQK